MNKVLLGICTDKVMGLKINRVYDISLIRLSLQEGWLC